jgi:zinc/manganese transport system substrate-binding protein
VNLPRKSRLWMLTAWRNAAVVALAICAAAASAGCGAIANGEPGPRTVRVVAAENFWGSIAAQLGGDRASVDSVINNPNEDPHSYEPTASDARQLAAAQLVIVNGIGYDPWAPRLLAADGESGDTVLDVGRLLALKDGDNPHRWYDPADVETIANAITASLKKLDPEHASYYQQQRAKFENQGLASYHRLIASIRARYGGTAVGASESIFALQAPALGLKLITPNSFLKATSEGTEVSAQDTLTVQRQLESHQIKVWIYNSQNATPEIQRLNALARAQHIPVTTITETLSPARATFEQWQTSQLQRIAQALHQATGR